MVCRVPEVLEMEGRPNTMLLMLWHSKNVRACFMPALSHTPLREYIAFEMHHAVACQF